MLFRCDYAEINLLVLKKHSEKQYSINSKNFSWKNEMTHLVNMSFSAMEISMLTLLLLARGPPLYTGLDASTGGVFCLDKSVLVFLEAVETLVNLLPLAVLLFLIWFAPGLLDGEMRSGVVISSGLTWVSWKKKRLQRRNSFSPTEIGRITPKQIAGWKSWLSEKAQCQQYPSCQLGGWETKSKI